MFFYINFDDSENHTDSMFAAVEKSGEVIPVVGFMQGGISRFHRAVYGISSGGQEGSHSLENRVQQVSLSEKLCCACAG